MCSFVCVCVCSCVCVCVCSIFSENTKGSFLPEAKRLKQTPLLPDSEPQSWDLHSELKRKAMQSTALLSHAQAVGRIRSQIWILGGIEAK